MGENDDPKDPLTALQAEAVMAHELFAAYVAAGFAPAQALYLLGVVVSTNMRNSHGPPSGTSEP